MLTAGLGWLPVQSPAQMFTTLHAFAPVVNGTNSDGQFPYPALALSGVTLFGTAYNGGTNGNGTVFKLDPAGKETVLYTFCSQSGCADGANPYEASVIMDKKGNLYGTTILGGSTSCNSGSGCGTVFKLTPTGEETVLYAFCSQPNCTDGQYPWGG